MRTLTFISLLALTTCTMAQDLPYYQIPEAPDSYSANNVLSRMIDGLGYRYYWATKDLTEKDLQHKVSESSRTTLETLEHIHGLSEVVLNTVKNEPTIRSTDRIAKSFEELRSETLIMLKDASDLSRKGDVQAEDMKVKFKRGDAESAFPLWNLLNGPLADALWHTGQIVMIRRASGNPLQEGVSVFMGKTRE